MKQSQLFAKTKRETPKEAETISHQYLVRGDFIDQEISGVYSLLPLGWRVHQKIEQIIREEMDAIGGQEVFLPTLQPKKLWQETGRWQTMDPPLFKFKDRHRTDLALGSTHEEVITDLVRKRIRQAQDLPLYLYQIQNKFRNEMRSSGGLLRVREFIMKDLYSFHKDEKDLNQYYRKVVKSYFKVFKRCGLKVVGPITAESGSIGGEESHEFALLAETGEDKVAICQKCNQAIKVEIMKGKKCPHCQGKVIIKNCIENGHIFKLGTKYSQAMKANFVDKDGKEKPIVMGCYGIGLGRLMAAIVEASHDKRGIIWPLTVAPFKIHLIALGTNRQIVKETEKLYRSCQKENIEVLYDDRDKSAGVKFADSDLIGIPYRVVISEQTLAKNSVEIKKREEKKTKLVKTKDALKNFKVIDAQ